MELYKEKSKKVHKICSKMNYDSKSEILVGSNLYINKYEKMKGQLEVNPFPTRKSEKTLIEPVIKKKIS